MAKAICKCYPIQDRQTVYEKLKAAIGKRSLTGPNGWQSYNSNNGYNDNPVRTFAQILRVVRKANV
jgi:hypothetical protein